MDVEDAVMSFPLSAVMLKTLAGMSDAEFNIARSRYLALLQDYADFIKKLVS
jgi:hypothetical protein